MRVFKMMLFIGFFFNSVAKCFNLVGNTYKASIRVPLIRRSQDIRLKFNSEVCAALQLSGFIRTSGNIYYKMHDDNDNIEFIPDKSIEKITKKFRLSLTDASYDDVTDTAKINIKSSLLFIEQEIIFYRDYDYN